MNPGTTPGVKPGTTPGVNPGTTPGTDGTGAAAVLEAEAVETERVVSTAVITVVAVVSGPGTVVVVVGG